MYYNKLCVYNIYAMIKDCTTMAVTVTYDFNYISLAVYTHKMAVTYTVAWSLVSSPFLTSLSKIPSELFSCGSLQGKEEHLHQTRFAQPLLLHVHGDTLEVS